LPTVDALNKAYEEVQVISKAFKTMVNKISVEMIGENEESIIIIEQELS
jgi:hypothetical protein